MFLRLDVLLYRAREGHHVRGRPLVVKVGVVLDAPRVRLRVGASRTRGDELFEHGVPHLRVPSVSHAVQDDAARATRSVRFNPGQ